MALTYEVNNDDLYRQYARFTSDYVQSIRDNDNGSYSDRMSYADTIKMDIFEDEHTFEVIRDFTEAFVNGDFMEAFCYFPCGMFDIDFNLSCNYENLDDVLDTLGSALIKYDFKIKDCYGHLFNYSTVFNVAVIK